MADRHDDSIHQLRRDIDRTTIDMHETIGAIRRKLDPDHLKQQAQDAVREATVGRAEDSMSKAIGRAEDAASNARDTAMDTASGIMETIRRNPIPAALAGIGLGWVFMNRSETQSGSRYYDRREPYYGEPSLRSHYGSSGTSYGERSTESTTTAYQGGSRPNWQPGETESRGALDQAAEKASETRQAAAEMMDRVRAKAGNLMEDSGEMTMSRGSGLLETIRENPLAAALTGIGIGWLLMNGGSRQTRFERDYGYTPDLHRERWSGDIGASGRTAVPEGRRGIGDTVEQAQGTVSDLASRAQGTAEDISDRVQTTVGDVSNRVQQQVGSMGYQTRRQYGRVEDRFQETLSTNPLAIGAAAIALGAVAATLTPTTTQERRYMGEARDSLMEQVQSTAQETMDKVQRVAESTQESVKAKAKEEGLAE